MSEEMLAGIVPVPKEEAALLLEAGYLLMELGKAREAEELFSGITFLLPKSDVARVALGNLHFSQNRLQKALKAHQDALRVRPDSALAKAHIGECLLFMGKKSEGVAALEECIAMNDDDVNDFAHALLQAATAGELG